MGWKKYLPLGLSVAKIFAPGGAGIIIGVVESSIDDKDDADNVEALRALAETQAELIERVTKLENKRV